MVSKPDPRQEIPLRVTRITLFDDLFGRVVLRLEAEVDISDLWFDRQPYNEVMECRALIDLSGREGTHTVSISLRPDREAETPLSRRIRPML